MRNSQIYRNFRYEAIRYKFFRHQWINYDVKNKEVTLQGSGWAKFQILNAALPVLSFCSMHLHHLCTKESLNIFNFLSLLTISTTIAILAHVIAREKEIHRMFYSYIHGLELADHLLSKVFWYSKRNRFVNRSNDFMSVALLIHNALSVPAVVLFVLYPSTKMVGVLLVMGVYLWPSCVYGMFARRLIGDRLNIFDKVLRTLSHRTVDEPSCR